MNNAPMIMALSSSGFPTALPDKQNHSPSNPASATSGIPPRPARNPARHKGKERAGSRPSTATGTCEEVTPWELFPGPPEESDDPGDDTDTQNMTSKGKPRAKSPPKKTPARVVRICSIRYL